MTSPAVQESKSLTLCVFSRATSLLLNLRLEYLVVGIIHVLVVPAIVTAFRTSPMQPIVRRGP